MNVATRIGGRGRRSPIAAVLVAALLLTLPGAVLAQDADQSSAPEPDASGVEFPIMLGGQLLTAETFTGPQWLDQVDDGETDLSGYIEGTEALVADVGKTLDDLTVKSALYQPSPGNNAVVVAMRIEGVDARDFAAPAIALMLGDVVEPDLLLRPLGDKWALRVVDATMPGVYPRTAYLKDDTVWIIEGDEDYVWDALDQLPDPDPVGESAADTLFTDVPLSLEGRRRVGLYETTEPLFLPTFGERLGDTVDPWLADLYLEAGISPSEMIGVYGWWGLPSPENGLQIEGYRLPPGGEEQLQRLLTDIFLARPAEEGADPETTSELSQSLTGIGFSEGEFAGRQVTTLDYGTAVKHIFGSEDGETIWVVTDPSSEPSLVEAAVAALP